MLHLETQFRESPMAQSTTTTILVIGNVEDKIRCDRGEVADLIIKGILQKNSEAQYEVILDEVEAIETGLARVDKGGLVAIFPESITRTIYLIEKRNPIADEYLYKL